MKSLLSSQEVPIPRQMDASGARAGRRRAEVAPNTSFELTIGAVGGLASETASVPTVSGALAPSAVAATEVSEVVALRAAAAAQAQHIRQRRPTYQFATAICNAMRANSEPKGETHVTVTFERPPIHPPEETTAIDDPREPIRQGDIFTWRTPEPPWKSHGVVVTADCDISKRKHAGIISYVPVLPLVEYWRLFSLPKSIKQYVENTYFPQLQKRITALQRKNCGDFPRPLISEEIVDFITLSTPEEVAAVLEPPPPADSALIRQISAYQAYAFVTDSTPFDALVSLLADLRAAMANSPPRRDRVHEELRTSIDNLPGDAFFLSGLGFPAHVPSIAYLRFVREVPLEHLSVTSPTASEPDSVAYRIARLRPPFVYRVTQQLAHVFSDIGLPSSYETRRSQVLRAVLPQQCETN